ncbi:LysE family translocator [Methanobacterium alcaliphilum]|uniref:LysE family translocator n=1 Tax=Methanobacterium alcaliphilum TaxID=392018 RepID=UPI00200ACDA3|nr:LysE family translocator [Methanobacterium alcaliphilum]MCK9151394.1 LysE family translocator [Methanobacterium alcaliphilum]
MIELLLAGITLGLYAGFSPGPLLVLVISQTIKHGYKEGFKVAFAPIISDIPIIIICLLFLSLISGYDLVLGIISLIGGVYLGYLSYECFKTKGTMTEAPSKQPKSLQKGVILNLLNPSPYIFWITIGGPIIIPAYNNNPLSLLLFIAGFYSFLVGSKIVLSYAVGKSRDFLTGTLYLHIMRVLGGVLVIFSLYFLKQGIQLIF